MQHMSLTWLKWSGLAVSVGSVLVAAVMLLLAEKAPPPAEEQVEEPAQTQIEKLDIVERKGERLVWRLQAERAEQQEDGSMLLSAPLLELVTESGKVVPVRGRQAWFEPLERNIRFAGDVRVGYQSWKLASEELIFDSSRDELKLPRAFRISGEEGVRGSGSSLRLHRGSGRVRIDGGLEASKGEKMRIRSGRVTGEVYKSRAEFTDGAEFVRDDMHLTGDRIVVHGDDAGGIGRIEAFGSVKIVEGEVRGSADSAVFEQREQQVVLMGNAMLEKPGGRVSGERIVHQLGSEVTHVEQGESGRVRLTIDTDKNE